MIYSCFIKFASGAQLRDEDGGDVVSHLPTSFQSLINIFPKELLASGGGGGGRSQIFFRTYKYFSGHIVIFPKIQIFFRRCPYLLPFPVIFRKFSNIFYIL